MATHPEILLNCLERTAAESGAALGRCVEQAVASLQQAETQTIRLAERDVLASSWRLMQSSKQTWSDQFKTALSSEFTDALAQQPPITKLATKPLASKPAAFGERPALGGLSLSLVDDADIKQAIDSKRLLQSLMPDLEQTLAELDALVSSAQGLPHVMPERNPMRPDVFTRLVQQLMLTTTKDPGMVELWLKHVAKPLSREIRQIYKKATKELQQARIPAARYYYRAQPDAAARPPALSAAREADFSHPPSSQAAVGSAGAASFAPELPQYADLSNYEIRAELLEDFLAHGGGTARHRLAAPYYAEVDQELASLNSAEQASPTTAWSDSARATYQRVPAVSRPQRAVNASTTLSEQVWGPYGTSRARTMVRNQLKKEATSVHQVLGLDVVRQLVNHVAQDPRLLAPVREAIVALEPSLLRLAMVDPRFFSDERHAGRQLMEQVAQRSFKYNDEFSPEFAAFYQDITHSFNRLNASAIDDAQEFGAALTAFQHSWHAQDQKEIDKRAQVLAALRFAEDRQARADQIAFDLSARSDLEKVPGKVLDFLFGPWALAMAHARLTDTRNQIDPEGYGSVVPDLVWSVKRDVTLKQPAKLIEMIPGLLEKLHSGLALLGQDPRENEVFFESLMKLHRPVLKLRRLKSQRDAEESSAAHLEPEEALVSPAERLEKLRAKDDAPLWMGRNDLDAAGFEDTLPTAPADLEPADVAANTAATAAIASTSSPSHAAAAMPVVQKSPTESNGAPTLEQASVILQSLRTGRWVDLYSKREWLRAQLVWASSKATLFMFISHGGQPHSMTKRSCEKLIAQRLLRPVDSKGVVAQALDAVAESVAAQRRAASAHAAAPNDELETV